LTKSAARASSILYFAALRFGRFIPLGILFGHFSNVRCLDSCKLKQGMGSKVCARMGTASSTLPVKLTLTAFSMNAYKTKYFEA
jgi:hypothetical protein